MRLLYHRSRGAFVLVALFVALGCSGAEQSADSGSMGTQEESGSMGTAQGSMGAQGSLGMQGDATCILQPTEGSAVTGTIVFTRVDGGVKVAAHVMGLTPGDHGIHVHEFGDCSALDGGSAGGHFNPTGMPHGGPDAAERHVGDLGNLTADSTGMANYERIDALLSLDGEHSIVGRAIIVHADADDLTTQPTGAAGARVACGVIEEPAAE